MQILEIYSPFSKTFYSYSDPNYGRFDHEGNTFIGHIYSSKVDTEEGRCLTELNGKLYDVWYLPEDDAILVQFDYEESSNFCFGLSYIRTLVDSAEFADTERKVIYAHALRLYHIWRKST